METQNDDDDHDNDDDDGRQLVWPEENSLEEVISALRNENEISELDFTFNNESWDISRELQDALIAVDNSPSFNVKFIHTFRLFNNCLHEEKRKRCLDLFLEYVQRHSESTYFFRYLDFNNTPWTIVESQKTASMIASINSPIGCLELSGNHFFSNKGTFECIFNEILDGGLVEEFQTAGESFFDLKHGCIGRSNLGTNTTLRCLELELYEDDGAFVADEGIAELAIALRTNQGLEELSFTRGLMKNCGRRKLLKSLRDNISLLSLDTVVTPISIDIDDDDRSDDVLLRLEGGIEGRELQSKINKHMKLNKFWKNLEEHRNTKSLDPNKIYPDVLEVLGKKPLLLYKFLREKDHTQLFGSFYNNNNNIRASSLHRKRRRSERLLKKRRLTAPGNAY